MKLRWLAAAAAAPLIMAASGNGCSSSTSPGPPRNPAFNVNIAAGPITMTGNHELVVGLVSFATNEMPRSFEAYVRLEFEYRGHWLTEASAIVHSWDLLPGGTYRARLVAGQARGRWRLVFMASGVSSSGEPGAIPETFWPSEAGQKIGGPR